MSVKVKIKKRIRKIKLTTRITLSNVVLFTMLILLIMYFVTVLTNRFLVIKNRDELLTRQQQIMELLKTEKNTIDQISPDDRISYIYQKFESIYVIDHFKTMLLVYDTNGNTSYVFDKDFYDILMLNQLKINPRNIRLQLDLRDHAEDGLETMHFNLFKHLDVSERILYSSFPINVPSRHGSPILTEAKLMGYDLMYTTVRYDLDPDYSAFVTVTLYPAVDKDFLLSLNSALLVSAMLGVLFLTVFGKWFTRRALRPLVELSDMAKNVESEILSYRIPPTDSNDEIDTLIKSLNHMLENLEQSFEHQKRFVSDASHELRIPLTIVLGYIDLLKTMGTDNQALLEESLTTIGDEATNMKNMVERLLVLARLENKRLRIEYESVHSTHLFNKTIFECIHLYPTHRFTSEIHYEGTLDVDVELFNQVLRALVENAVKYSEPGTTITFICEKKNRFIEVSVIDQGKGIPKESITNLANRFYRLSEDRNRKTGGTGLGLSIVDALIKAHGGHMRIESTVDEGTKVSLFIPIKSGNP